VSFRRKRLDLLKREFFNTIGREATIYKTGLAIPKWSQSGHEPTFSNY
jgi:hypothetical protein